MAIGVTAREFIDNPANLGTFATAAFTPSASELLIAIEAVTEVDQAPTTPTVTGHDNGVAWILIASLIWDSLGGAGAPHAALYVFACVTGASPGSATVSFAHGTLMTGCIASVFEVSGADEANGLVQTFVQAPDTGANVAAATSGSITLAAAGHADNRPFAVFARADTGLTTSRTNWTEIHDNAHSPPNSSSETQWRSGAFDSAASASWTNSSLYGGIAFEIKALAVPASLLLRPNPMRHMLVR